MIWVITKKLAPKFISSGKDFWLYEIMWWAIWWWKERFQGSFWKESAAKHGSASENGRLCCLRARGNGCREKSRGTTGESGKIFNIELITEFIIQLFVLTFLMPSVCMNSSVNKVRYTDFTGECGSVCRVCLRSSRERSCASHLGWCSLKRSIYTGVTLRWLASGHPYGLSRDVWCSSKPIGSRFIGQHDTSHHLGFHWSNSWEGKHWL